MIIIPSAIPTGTHTTVGGRASCHWSRRHRPARRPRTRRACGHCPRHHAAVAPSPPIAQEHAYIWRSVVGYHRHMRIVGPVRRTPGISTAEGSICRSHGPAARCSPVGRAVGAVTDRIPFIVHVWRGRASGGWVLGLSGGGAPVSGRPREIVRVASAREGRVTVTVVRSGRDTFSRAICRHVGTTVGLVCWAAGAGAAVTAAASASAPSTTTTAAAAATRRAILGRLRVGNERSFTLHSRESVRRVGAWALRGSRRVL